MAKVKAVAENLDEPETDSLDGFTDIQIPSEKWESLLGNFGVMGPYFFDIIYPKIPPNIAREQYLDISALRQKTIPELKSIAKNRGLHLPPKVSRKDDIVTFIYQSQIPR